MLKSIIRYTVPILVLASATAFLGLWSGWIDINEGLKNVPLTVEINCTVSPAISYWKIASSDELQDARSGRHKSKGHPIRSGERVTIATLRPTIFRRVHQIGERWIVLEMTCDSDADTAWSTIVVVEEEMLRRGTIRLACPCDGEGATGNWKKMGRKREAGQLIDEVPHDGDVQRPQQAEGADGRSDEERNRDWSSWVDGLRILVGDDVILEQAEFICDSAGNVFQATSRRRYHNAPENQTGPLQDCATTPNAGVQKES